jgi:hypothetical protein
VAATLGRSRRLLNLGGAALAVGFLVAMALSGRVRESGQFVRFAAAGVLGDAPARVKRVEMIRDSERWVFARTAGGWRREPGPPSVPPPLATHLNDAIKFLHVSAPVRVLTRQEWAEQGLGEFGLDRPVVSAALYEDDRRLLAVEFGSLNPQKVLQYMRIVGRDDVYVMSRFVGEEWERVLGEAAR